MWQDIIERDTSLVLLNSGTARAPPALLNGCNWPTAATLPAELRSTHVARADGRPRGQDSQVSALSGQVGHCAYGPCPR